MTRSFRITAATATLLLFTLPAGFTVTAQTFEEGTWTSRSGGDDTGYRAFGGLTELHRGSGQHVVAEPKPTWPSIFEREHSHHDPGSIRRRTPSPSRSGLLPSRRQSVRAGFARRRNTALTRTGRARDEQSDYASMNRLDASRASL